MPKAFEDRGLYTGNAKLIRGVWKWLPSWFFDVCALIGTPLILISVF